MKDEIKEILKDNDELLVRYKDNSFECFDTLPINVLNYIANLQHQLRATETNEETFRLEMLEITKILGLDEHTLFDDVKEYAKNLHQENKRLKYQYELMENSLDERQEVIEEAINKLKEHKPSLDYEPWTIYKVSGSILFDLLNILEGSDKE